MSVIRFLSRSMLSATFVADGVAALREPSTGNDGSENVLVQWAIKRGVSADPQDIAKAIAAAQTTAGCLLAIGKLRRLSAMVLVATTVPSTYAQHRFWEFESPEDRAEHKTIFLKNVALVGGLILELVDTEGRPSLRWRARRAAGQMSNAVSARAGAPATLATGQQAAHAASVASQQAAHAASFASRQAAHAASAASRQAADLASRHGAQVADLIAREAGHAKELAARTPAMLAVERRALAAGANKASEKVARTSSKLAKEAEKSARRARQLGGVQYERVSEVLADQLERASEVVGSGAHRAGDLWGVGSERAAGLVEVGSGLIGELAASAGERAEAAWQAAAEHLPLG
jgi:uncharacterized membrane protein YphA (DoxX/SURF4 family)